MRNFPTLVTARWIAMAVICLTCAAAHAAEEPAAEKIDLRYKLPPNLELIYETDGRMFGTIDAGGMEMEQDFKITGTERLFVAGKDEETDGHLIGSLINAKMKGTVTSDGSEQEFARSTWESKVFRIDMRGKATKRPAAAEDELRGFALRMLRPLGEGNLSLLNLPDNPIGEGDSWQIDTSLPMQGGMALGARATCTFAGRRTVDGAECVVVRGKLTTPEASDDQNLNITTTGDVEVAFSIEKGLPIEEKGDLELSYPGDTGTFAWKYTVKLKSQEILADDEAAPRAAATLKMDQAVVKAFDGKTDDAIEGLEKFQNDLADLPNWRRALRTMVTKLKTVQRFSGGGGGFAAPTEPDEVMEDIGSLDPSKVTLKLENTTVSAVVEEIEKQTGNTLIKKKFNDMELPEFEAEDETFWQVIDRLCKLSKNVYAKEACGGGG